MNYYLAKSNPNKFRLEDILRTHPVTSLWTSLWRVCRDAKAGDILFIGLSGETAGIFARAIITSPSNHTPATNRAFFEKLAEAKPKWRAQVTISENRVDGPIAERTLATDGRFGRIVKWLHSQGGVCRLTTGEGEALDRLMRP